MGKSQPRTKKLRFRQDETIHSLPLDFILRMFYSSFIRRSRGYIKRASALIKRILEASHNICYTMHCGFFKALELKVS